jgi:hypothetical protein
MRGTNLGGVVKAIRELARLAVTTWDGGFLLGGVIGFVGGVLL